MTLKCDLQYGKGEASYRLSRVGVKNVRKPILVKREGPGSTLNNVLSCHIDIYVDLPADQKGSHMSRNVEVLNEVMESSINKPITGLEDVAGDICRKLMVRHEYAQRAEVSIWAEYFRPSKTPMGKDTYEVYKLMAGGVIDRDGGLMKRIGVEVVGMTACPCGQQTVTEMLEYNGEIPAMTHNQRNVSSIMVTHPDGMSLEADDLIDIVEDSFSSPTFELLKRPDEGQVIINAHSNTKFVEDVVRGILERFVKKYTDLPDSVYVDVISDSEESIHKHDAYAEREDTLGNLRKENL